MATSKKSKVEKKSGASANTARVVETLKELTAASAELRRKVPAGAALTSDDRRASNGKFRTGEDAVLAQVLDVVDARPALFSVLAAHDGGSDPATLETGPTRDALARKKAADEAVDAAELLVKALRDYALVAGEEVRALTAPAYAIIRANAAVDASLRDDAAAAMAFYQKSSRTKGAKPKG